MPSDVIQLSLADASAALDRGDVTSTELTEAAIARIAEIDRHLNAFITVTTEAALAAAQKADLDIAAGRRIGPLHGIPVSVKDLIDTAGIRTTSACGVFSDRVPDRDATVVTRLAAAGAIGIGKNNMLEVAYGEEHPDFGQTHTPWNLHFGASGSSSGSGSAVAAGMGYGSIGTDTGGSIRCPSVVCGIVGHKPTYGLVSRTGVMPLSWSLDHVGPMTRTVRDAALMLDAIAGHDPADPTSARRRLPSFAAALDEPRKHLVVGIVEVDGERDLDPGIVQASHEIARIVAGHGHEIRPVRLPLPDATTRAAMMIIYAEASSFHLSWLRERPEGYSVNTRERLELGALLPAATFMRAQRARRTIVDAHKCLFAGLDVVISPVMPNATHPRQAVSQAVDDEGDSLIAGLRYSVPFNMTGQPALAFPCGSTAHSLPVGLQIVGHPFGDATVLRLAAEIEPEARSLLPSREGNPLLV